MSHFTEKRIGYELSDFAKNNTLKVLNPENTKQDSFHLIKIHNTYPPMLFTFYLDENYPFSPPIKVLCNDHNITQCNQLEKYCYACHSILCNNKWSPTYRIKSVIDEYFHKLRESEVLHYLSLILKRKHIHLPIELKMHICIL